MFKKIFLFLILQSFFCFKLILAQHLEGAPEAHVKAIIIDYKGVPTLSIEGKPQFTMMMMAPWHQHETSTQGKIKLQAEVKAGIELHSTCDELSLADFSKFWYGPGQYDFSLIDEKLRSIQAINPKAYIMIKLFVQAPRWWVEAHPEEWVKYASATQPNKTQISLSSFDKEGAFVSYASERWRQDVRDMLKKFVAHIEATPWGKRVIGVNLLNGHAQEWHYWGSIFGLNGDLSVPMTHGFQKWLSNKYENDVRKLKAAWGDRSLTFGTVVIPGLEARKNAKYGYFRDPKKEAPIIDYYKFQHELTADVLIDFCQTVKDASNGRLLTGAYYGYLFHTPWYPDGHSLAMDKVLASPVVDFLAAPANYNDWLSRGLGGDALLRSLPEAIKAAGKLHIVESDEGTYKADRVHRPSEVMNSWEESIANMRKQWAQVLIRGVGQWWWDWDDNYGLYVHEPHIAALKEMKQLGDISIHLDRRSNAEVALVYDPKSLYYVKTHIGNPTWEMIDAPTHVAARSGFAFDLISLHDLNRKNLPTYKLYIFTQTYAVDNKMKNRIQQILKRNGATAIWYYAPGFVSENGLSLKAMETLTGIHIKHFMGDVVPRIQLENWGNAILLNFRKDKSTVNRIVVGNGKDDGLGRSVVGEKFVYGQNEGTLNPVFYADDPKAKVLGYLENTNKPGLVVKKMDGYTSIYSSAYISSTELLSAIAREVGVHLYSDQDQVLMVNRHFICIPSLDRNGATKISLPYATDVYDCFQKKWLGIGVKEFEVELSAKTTQLFYYGSKSDFTDAVKLAGQY